MHIERVHFDEVFDVQAGRGDFSFRTGGRPRYGVNLHAGVIPRAGSTFAVAFEQPGKWDTVLGCRDLASSEVRLRRPGYWSMLAQTGDFILFGPVFIVGGLLIGGAWPGVTMAALLLLAMAWVVVRALRLNRAVEQALRCAGDIGNPLDNTSTPRAGTIR